MTYPDWIYRKANIKTKRGWFVTTISIEDTEYKGKWYHKRLWRPSETRIQEIVADARAGMVLMKQRELNKYWARNEAA